MPLRFPTFVTFKPAADYVYISETIENWQENIQNKEDIYIYIVTLNVAKEVVSKALLARGSFHIAR
jgi:hypothetical protein